jgi:hypothetical protein
VDTFFQDIGVTGEVSLLALALRHKGHAHQLGGENFGGSHLHFALTGSPSFLFFMA